jgi:hypothetical protein
MGPRSHVAIRILKAHGFEDTVNVTGGQLSMELEPGLVWERA